MAELDPAPPASTSSRARGIALLLVAATVAVAIAHIQLVQFFCDDSYISYRYARNLADGLGLVYNPGEEPVEGYSNFLWVILLAAAFPLGLSPESWSLALGLVCLAATLALTAALVRPLVRGHPVFVAAAPFLLACLGPVMLWSSAGMETILFTALVLAALFTTDRAAERPLRLLAAGVLYGLASLTRPEGVVFGGVAGLYLCATGVLARRPLPRLLASGGALAGGFALVFLPFLLWRHAYYQDWVPNTFHIKAGSVISFHLGLQYLAYFVEDYPVLWLATLAGVCVAFLRREHAPHRNTLTPVLLALVAGTLAVAWEGGDYMALYRFLAPLLPLAVVFVVLALHALYTELWSWKPGGVWAPLGLVALGGVGYSFFLPSPVSCRTESDPRFINSVWTMRRNSEQWVAVGKSLGEVLWPGARVCTTAAGAIPYYSGALALDQSGLSDRYTAREAWDPWLIDRPGHMKQATREHIEQLGPDLILWHPRIWRADSVPIPPWKGYVPRALKVDTLRGDEGEDLYLYFLLHQDRVPHGAVAGMKPLAEVAQLAGRPEPQEESGEGNEE